jgi:hypothetical protein
MGRKPIPQKFVRSRRVAVMLTEAEFRDVEKACKKMEFASVSDFLRAATVFYLDMHGEPRRHE